MFVAIAKESFKDEIVSGKLYPVIEVLPSGTFIIVNNKGHNHYIKDQWLGFSLIQASGLTQDEKEVFCMLYPQLEAFLNVHTK